jgi:hypothetical protein
MKNEIFLIITILVAYAFFAACEKEKPHLPPETQTGANTFGCYINGKLFVPKNTIFGRSLNASYNNSEYESFRKGIHIGCTGIDDNYITIYLQNHTVNSNIII